MDFRSSSVLIWSFCKTLIAYKRPESILRAMMTRLYPPRPITRICSKSSICISRFYTRPSFRVRALISVEIQIVWHCISFKFSYDLLEKWTAKWIPSLSTDRSLDSKNVVFEKKPNCLLTFRAHSAMHRCLPETPSSWVPQWSFFCVRNTAFLFRGLNKTFILA